MHLLGGKVGIRGFRMRHLPALTGLVSVNGSPYSTGLRVTRSPGGVNHTLIWNALTNLGPNVTTNVFLRARAHDITLLGNWSVGTPFHVSTATNPDVDNDGLPDAWEGRYFGSNTANPGDDPDGDGSLNWQEYIADTIPTNGLSFLRITGVSVLPASVKLDWLGGIGATQLVQRNFTLTDTNSLWLNISTSLPPTPISGSYTDSLDTNALKFYRIRVTR